MTYTLARPSLCVHSWRKFISNPLLITSWEGPTAHSSPDAVHAFEKLVFGTDERPENRDSCVARYEAMLEACGVPEPSRRKIYGETLAGILGIKVKA